MNLDGLTLTDGLTETRDILIWMKLVTYAACEVSKTHCCMILPQLTSTDQSALAINYLAISSLSAGNMGWLYGLAMGWLLAIYRLSLGWLWASNGPTIGHLAASR